VYTGKGGDGQWNGLRGKIGIAKDLRVRVGWGSFSIQRKENQQSVESNAAQCSVSRCSYEHQPSRMACGHSRKHQVSDFR
jgi:hypothetical protein